MVPGRRAAKTIGHDTGAALRVALERGVLDTAAFEQMVLTYAQPLTAFAWRYVQSDELAVDVVQDVFTQVWERRADLGVRTNLRAYLFAATRNRALNALAHARIESRWRERAVQGEVPRTAPDASELAERTELSAAVATALRSLPPRAQEIARLRWIDHLSRREIAEVLGVALPTVSVHLTRTVKRLRGLLRRFAP
jgi:RNA polymerase sigma-70 factor (ECF subfamily)